MQVRLSQEHHAGGAESGHDVGVARGHAMLEDPGSCCGRLARDINDVLQRHRDAVEWAAHAPWSNGRVALMGLSYAGFTALLPTMAGVAIWVAVHAMREL